MKKIFLFLMLGLFLISFASATSDLVFKQRDFVNYSFVCLDTNNNLCNAQTSCQITLNYPNGTNIVENTSMIYDTTSFKYLLKTEEIGNNDWIITCLGTTNGFSEGFYQVTPSGFAGTLGFYILILIFSLGMIILGYSVKDAWVIILGGMGLVLVGLFILFYGIDGIKDEAYIWGIGIITLMLGAYFGIRGSLEQMGY